MNVKNQVTKHSYRKNKDVAVRLARPATEAGLNNVQPLRAPGMGAVYRVKVSNTEGGSRC